MNSTAFLAKVQLFANTIIKNIIAYYVDIASVNMVEVDSVVKTVAQDDACMTETSFSALFALLVAHVSIKGSLIINFKILITLIHHNSFHFNLRYKYHCKECRCVHNKNTLKCTLCRDIALGIISPDEVIVAQEGEVV